MRFVFWRSQRTREFRRPRQRATRPPSRPQRWPPACTPPTQPAPRQRSAFPTASATRTDAVSSANPVVANARLAATERDLPEPLTTIRRRTGPEHRPSPPVLQRIVAAVTDGWNARRRVSAMARLRFHVAVTVRSLPSRDTPRGDHDRPAVGVAWVGLERADQTVPAPKSLAALGLRFTPSNGTGVRTWYSHQALEMFAGSATST